MDPKTVLGIDIGIAHYALCKVHLGSGDPEVLAWGLHDLRRGATPRVTHNNAHLAVQQLFVDHPEYLDGTDAVVVEGQMAYAGGAPDERTVSRGNDLRDHVDTILAEAISAADTARAAGSRLWTLLGDVAPEITPRVTELCSLLDTTHDMREAARDAVEDALAEGRGGGAGLLPCMTALQAATVTYAEARGVHAEILSPRTVKARFRSVFGTNGRGSYRGNKLGAVTLTRDMVPKEVWTRHVLRRRKQDDMCDAFLIAWVWYDRAVAEAAKEQRKADKAAAAAARKAEKAARAARVAERKAIRAAKAASRAEAK